MFININAHTGRHTQLSADTESQQSKHGQLLHLCIPRTVTFSQLPGEHPFDIQTTEGNFSYLQWNTVSAASGKWTTKANI